MTKFVWVLRKRYRINNPAVSSKSESEVLQTRHGDSLGLARKSVGFRSIAKNVGSGIAGDGGAELEDSFAG